MRKSSKDIRTYASVHGIWLWRVAERVGLSDYRLSRSCVESFRPTSKRSFSRPSTN